jgi:hypothetical protein
MSLRWISFALLAIASRAEAIPPIESLAGPWKQGDKWVVEYRFEQPSPSATANPGKVSRTRSWRYEVVSLNPRRLLVTADDDDQQVELEFDVAPPHALVSGVVYGRNYARERVRLNGFENPERGRSYFTELLAGPFIASHPALAPDGGAARQVTRHAPDNRVEVTLSGGRQSVTFVWSIGAKWWSEAWSGAVSARTRIDPFPTRRTEPLPVRLKSADLVRGTTAATPQVKECGRRAGEHGPVSVQLTIAPDGTVTSASVVGPRAGGASAACVEEVLRRTLFPQSGSSLKAKVAFQFD